MTNTPLPTYESEPEDEPEEPTFILTNSQRYFEDLVSKNSTNILLLGTEPTGFNFDTIIVLSIDDDNKEVKIISFPRDIYRL